jgi:integral membrane protein
MKSLFITKIGRLRLFGYLEGLSLLVLVFIAVPLKHVYNSPVLSSILGPVHGAIFLVFILNVIGVGIEQGWTFKTTTWKIVLACFVPFGTFYMDHILFKNIKEL